MAETCRNCKYMQNDNGDLSCRRYPPLVIDAKSEPVYVDYPPIRPDNWCGEWQLLERT